MRWLSVVAVVIAALMVAPGSVRADMDCDDFSSQSGAQAYFELHGGSALYNLDRLDADHDGIACERDTYSSYGVSSDDYWIPPSSSDAYIPDPDFDDEPRAPTVNEIKDMIDFWGPIIGVVFGILILFGLIGGAISLVREVTDSWKKPK